MATVREIFQELDACPDGAILFVDECESIFSRRDKDTETSPRYGDRIRRADAFVEKRAGSKGKADLGKTADAIIREASKKKFRALRIIGAKWKLTAMLVRNLPADATDGLMTKVFSEN